MDRLQLAQHRFQQISPLLLKSIDGAASDAVETWLRDNVCPVAEQLCKNRRFQQFARWSVDHLAPETKAPQRKLVEAVDRALIECARASAAAADSLGILVRVDRQGGNAEGAIRQTAPLESGSTASRPSDRELSVIEWIATRPFFDLVCVDEYFDGSRGLHLRTFRNDCSDDFWKMRDPRVPLGDYVCRGMLLRIEYFARRIQETWETCFDEAQRRGSEQFPLAKRLFSAKTRMDGAIASLREACHKGEESRLREACTTLIQVYAGYAPNPELDWLKLSKHFSPGYAPAICSVVHPPANIVELQKFSNGRLQTVGHSEERLCRPDVVNGIAGALDVVSAIYRRPIDADELVDWLRHTKRLVMVDRRPRTVFWDDDEIGWDHLKKIDWDRRSALWDFLWNVARCAQKRQALDREELTGSDPRTNRIKHRRSELKKVIPKTLDDLIEDVRPRGYRLNLDPDEIELLAVNEDEQLVEAEKLRTSLPL
jgi:hypothetical protein